MDRDMIQKKVNATICNCSSNLFEIAEHNNILVLEKELGSINGLYLYLQKNKLILLNAQLSESHKKLILAHEIGHAVLHTRTNCAFTIKYCFSKKGRLEREANCFGTILLNKLRISEDDSLCIYENELSIRDKDFIRMLLLGE